MKRPTSERDKARCSCNDPNPITADTVEQATGLDRRGVADILNIIERTVANPAMQKAVAEYRQMLVYRRRSRTK